jgi:hypothetical protein
VICGERQQAARLCPRCGGKPARRGDCPGPAGRQRNSGHRVQGKGDGKVEFVLGGGQYVTVARDNDGREQPLRPPMG